MELESVKQNARPSRTPPLVTVIELNTSMGITGIELYRLLESAKITWSRRDCSAFVFGMNPSYLAQRGDRELSERALVNAFRHLWAERKYWLAWQVARAILFGGSGR